jgi:hypothetical protein
VNLFRFIPGYEGVIFDEGKEPLFLLLLAFLIAFAATRGYTRLARKHGWGSGSVGGVHLHHVVVGIVFVLAAGLAAFTRAGTGAVVRDLCGIVFGVGAAFVLDEFALVFYLPGCSPGARTERFREAAPGSGRVLLDGTVYRANRKSPVTRAFSVAGL